MTCHLLSDMKEGHASDKRLQFDLPLNCLVIETIVFDEVELVFPVEVKEKLFWTTMAAISKQVVNHSFFFQVINQSSPTSYHGNATDKYGYSIWYI